MTKLEAYMDAVLDALIAGEEDGVYCGAEPGQVLGRLAQAADVPYKAVSLIVLRLEAMGLVEVEHKDHDEHRRANRIVCIRLA